MRRSTKIFLDSGDPADTEKVLEHLQHLDGQTTNPSLVAKSPEAAKRSKAGDCFTPDELNRLYRTVVERISQLIPAGSVSIEVNADASTDVEEMVRQAKEVNQWIPNAHVKFPTIRAGLEAAQQVLREGVRINMTLVFTQTQAAAVYAATQGAKRGDVLLSPFVGRLDDQGKRGVDVIANIQKMYSTGDGHVEVLAASIRSVDHLHQMLNLKADIATVPITVLMEWDGRDGAVSQLDASLESIAYQELDLKADWRSFELGHELTTQGLARFASDWNELIHCKQSA